MCKKSVEIVKETEQAVVATVLTGANYYIDIFPKESLDFRVGEAARNHHSITYEEVIQNVNVTDMLHLCRQEDFCQELLNDAIGYILEWGENNA